LRLNNKLQWQQAAAIIVSSIVALVVIDQVAGRGLELLVKSTGFRYARLYSGDLPTDILVIGNSRGVNAVYAPDWQGVGCPRVANLSFNGTSVTIARALLADYYRLNGAPKALLVEISGLIGAPSDVVDLMPFNGFGPAISEETARYSTPMRHFASYLRLPQFNSEIALRSLAYLSHDDQNWINGGSISLGQIAAAPRSASILNARKIPELNAIALKSIFETAHKLGIVVLPFLAPYHPSLIDSGLLTQPMLKVAQDANGGEPILDLSRKIVYDEAYADLVHTNRKGAAQLAPTLRAELAALRPALSCRHWHVPLQRAGSAITPP
jgi:hypothetical protein